jgi:hypothetical protein
VAMGMGSRADGGQEKMLKAQHRCRTSPRRGRDARTAGEVLSGGQVGCTEVVATDWPRGGCGLWAACKLAVDNGRRVGFVSGPTRAAARGGYGGGASGKTEGEGEPERKRPRFCPKLPLVGCAFERAMQTLGPPTLRFCPR